MAVEAPSNRVQVAFSGAPLSRYTSASKKVLAESENGECMVSGLGLAISTVVSVSEVLRSEGWAVQSKVTTSLETGTSDGVPKTKIEVVLKKSAKFDELYAASVKEAQAKAETEAA